MLASSTMTFVIQDMTGQKLDYTLYGKPMSATYQYAETVLNKIAPIHRGTNGMPRRRTVYGKKRLPRFMHSLTRRKS